MAKSPKQTTQATDKNKRQREKDKENEDSVPPLSTTRKEAKVSKKSRPSEHSTSEPNQASLIWFGCRVFAWAGFLRDFSLLPRRWQGWDGVFILFIFLALPFVFVGRLSCLFWWFRHSKIKNSNINSSTLVLTLLYFNRDNQSRNYEDCSFRVHFFCGD